MQTGIHDNGSFVDIQGQYAASIKGLQSGSTYTLQVACCNVIWCSPRSASISVTTTLRGTISILHTMPYLSTLTQLQCRLIN